MTTWAGSRTPESPRSWWPPGDSVEVVGAALHTYADAFLGKAAQVR
ncbi:hypothetical protein ACIP79_01600 [Streptomyces sp. NPDC088747]